MRYARITGRLRRDGSMILPRNLHVVNAGAYTDTEIWSSCDDCGGAVTIAHQRTTNNGRWQWELTNAIIEPMALISKNTTCLCESCADERINAGDLYRCAECGALTESAEPIDDEGAFCSDCLSELATQCFDCGRWTREANYITDIAEYMCSRCTARACYYCEDCDTFVTENSWNSREQMCEDCASALDEIPDYHSARRNGFDFFGRAPYIGRELEVERARSDIRVREMAEDICFLMNNCGERVQVERDGSLNNGFEMVFSPHSAEAWDYERFGKVLDTLKRAGYRSHDTGTCGYHLHFSREWFGEGLMQSRNVANFVNAVSANYDALAKIARRTPATASHWARNNGIGQKNEQHTGSIAVRYCKSKKAGRYQAVNLTNPLTVEIRLCRGSLRLESLRAWDDLMTTMVRNSSKVKYGETDLKRWTQGITDATSAYIQEKTGLEV